MSTLCEALPHLHDLRCDKGDIRNPGAKPDDKPHWRNEACPKLVLRNVIWKQRARETMLQQGERVTRGSKPHRAITTELCRSTGMRDLKD